MKKSYKPVVHQKLRKNYVVQMMTHTLFEIETMTHMFQKLKQIVCTLIAP